MVWRNVKETKSSIVGGFDLTCGGDRSLETGSE